MCVCACVCVDVCACEGSHVPNTANTVNGKTANLECGRGIILTLSHLTLSHPHRLTPSHYVLSYTPLHTTHLSHYIHCVIPSHIPHHHTSHYHTLTLSHPHTPLHTTYLLSHYIVSSHHTYRIITHHTITPSPPTVGKTCT